MSDVITALLVIITVLAVGGLLWRLVYSFEDIYNTVYDEVYKGFGNDKTGSSLLIVGRNLSTRAA